jgi:uncharacterized protein
MQRGRDRLNIAVVGSGISGLSAAWLLHQAHDVTIYERAPRLGGHTNTIDVPDANGASVPVDMGFIVFNPRTYPNLTALFAHLGVETRASDMSFGVSLRGGQCEYSGTDLRGLFAQPSNLLRPSFWGMLRDLARFYREAPRDCHSPEAEQQSLGAYLQANGYGAAFVRDHLLPMAAAIWSTPVGGVADHPAAGFIRFCDNHGLLQIRDRPEWRSVVGGSRTYIARLTESLAGSIRLGCGVRAIRRALDGVRVVDDSGAETRYDHVVIAVHSDQALAMLSDAGDAERALLGAILYGKNDATMHRDANLMPRRRAAWASWNYIGSTDSNAVCATYWMNHLQGFAGSPPTFVTLNPQRSPEPSTVIHRETYTHPLFNTAALRAQRDLWSLQGHRRTWYCGAYFGAGFHEDGLQAGLAVAEALGGVRRPWTVPGESGRIHLGTSIGALAA